MGAVGVNTAFCWRKRVRAERAKLQWPGGECEHSWGFGLGRADTGGAAPGKPAPSSTAHTFCGEAALEHPVISQGTGGHRCVPSRPYAALQDGASWPSTIPLLTSLLLGLAPGGSKGLEAICCTQATASGLAELKQLWVFFFLFLFSPPAMPGPGLCLSERHGILSKLLSGLWRCHKY